MGLGNMIIRKSRKLNIIYMLSFLLIINFMHRCSESDSEHKSELNQALKEFKPFKCKESLPYSRERFNTSFIICIKNPSLCPDISMSFYINGFGRIRGKGGLGTAKRYEEDLMNIWLVLINNYPQAVVLDFGSNIGAYTLASRTMGNKVIALDPDPENQALLYTSLVLNRQNGDTIQVRNAISDVYDEYFGKKGLSHGFMDLIDKENIDVGDTRLNNNNAWSIKSIKLSDIFDLVPEADTFIMKMDVQGFECRALTSYLKEVNKIQFLPYILMETMNHCAIDSTSPCEWVTEFLPLLELSGYIPHVPYPITYEALKGDCYNDVLFVHRDAKAFPYMDPDLAIADFRHTPDFPVPVWLIG